MVLFYFCCLSARYSPETNPPARWSPSLCRMDISTSQDTSCIQTGRWRSPRTRWIKIKTVSVSAACRSYNLSSSLLLLSTNLSVIKLFMIFLFEFFQVFIGDSFVKDVFHDVSENMQRKTNIDVKISSLELYYRNLLCHFLDGWIDDVQQKSLFGAAVKWTK